MTRTHQLAVALARGAAFHLGFTAAAIAALSAFARRWEAHTTRVRRVH